VLFGASVANVVKLSMSTMRVSTVVVEVVVVVVGARVVVVVAVVVEVDEDITGAAVVVVVIGVVVVEDVEVVVEVLLNTISLGSSLATTEPNVGRCRSKLTFSSDTL